MPGRDFSLHTRPTRKGKRVFYVQFRTLAGKWGTPHSTGETARRRAEAWAEAYLKDKGHFTPGKVVTFAEFSDGFFSWSGEWATEKKVSGGRISERYCIETADTLRRHVLTVFGPLRLADIDITRIKTFKNDLYRAGYSGSLINKCLVIIRAILSDAEERGLVRSVPKISKAAERVKEKGILDLDEVSRLFAQQWDDFRSYCGNLLAASTGLRIGELQGLTLEDVRLNDGYVVIRRSWNPRLSRLNESTKTGRARMILIPRQVRHELGRLRAVHPCQDPSAFFFWGENKPTEKPAEQKFFSGALYRHLEKIGIGDAERRRRNLTFHSWRHFLNSLLINAKIPLLKVQSVTGHSTDRMTAHYFHPGDMADVLQIQESIFTLTGDPGEDPGEIH